MNQKECSLPDLDLAHVCSCPSRHAVSSTSPPTHSLWSAAASAISTQSAPASFSTSQQHAAHIKNQLFKQSQHCFKSTNHAVCYLLMVPRLELFSGHLILSFQLGTRLQLTLDNLPSLKLSHRTHAKYLSTKFTREVWNHGLVFGHMSSQRKPKELNSSCKWSPQQHLGT